MEAKEKTGNTGMTGTALGLSIGALAAPGIANGLLGNLFGGNRPAPEPPATQRDLVYERQLTEKDMKIAGLEAKQYADQQVLATERRWEDKLDKLEEKVNAQNTAQAVLNARQTDAIAMVNNEILRISGVFAPYIKQPIMQVSEAALAIGGTASTANASGSGTGA